jgi:hypothetical protein
MIRTIEEILGLAPLNVHDAHARPMSAVFDLAAKDWSYTAQVPPVLRTTSLPLPARKNGEADAKPAHDAAYWAAKTQGFDFTAEDRLDAPAYNRILWQGLKGDQPYPVTRPGTNRRSPAGGH